MTDGSSIPFKLETDGSARLAVRVTPRAKRNELGGVVDSGGGRIALSIRLAAPPVEGAANRALIDFLAQRLDVSRSSIRLISGETSRLKILSIDAASEEALRALL